jgi:hypothetical protein
MDIEIWLNCVEEYANKPDRVRQVAMDAALALAAAALGGEALGGCAYCGCGLAFAEGACAAPNCVCHQDVLY